MTTVGAILIVVIVIGSVSALFGMLFRTGTTSVERGWRQSRRSRHWPDGRRKTFWEWMCSW